MSERRAYLDRGIGETRGVVTLDGRPERLLIRRDDDEPRLRLGARLIARVTSLEPALGTAFLDLGAGAEAILPFKPDARPVDRDRDPRRAPAGQAGAGARHRPGGGRAAPDRRARRAGRPRGAVPWRQAGRGSGRAAGGR